ncbi:restriction endonuclease, partial [Klebsiella pneumoniae]|nr:restriction endonuclease [Klebsiella pneumoniae]
DHFSVPANVDIIGAMNTADRSLALMDTALRRRFDFVEMMPDLSLLSGAKVKGIELESLLEKLNSRIEALYDR